MKSRWKWIMGTGFLSAAMLTIIMILKALLPSEREGIHVARVHDWCLLLSGSIIIHLGQQSEIRFQHVNGFDWAATEDFSRVALVRYCPETGSKVTIFDTDSGTEVGTYAHQSEMKCPSWSPNGRVLGVRAGQGVSLFNITSAGSPDLVSSIDLPASCQADHPPAVLNNRA